MYHASDHGFRSPAAIDRCITCSEIDRICRCTRDEIRKTIFQDLDNGVGNGYYDASKGDLTIACELVDETDLLSEFLDTFRNMDAYTVAEYLVPFVAKWRQIHDTRIL
jgi:hypothetical protein